MASIYKRKKSSYWWIKYRDPQTGKIVQESTNFKNEGPDTRRAMELAATKTFFEKNTVGAIEGKWGNWVVEFITQNTKGRSTERYLSAWRTIRMFLEEENIISPRDVTYKNCSAYATWRIQPDPKKGKHKCGVNTAALEFKIFRWIMREAVKRDYCTSNPAREVVLKRAERKLFPDLDDDTLQKIYAAILTEPEPDQTRFLRSFAISLFQGVRLAETNVNPTTDAKLDADPPTIQFLQKGGRKRIKPIHPQLIPLFRRLQAEKATETYNLGATKKGPRRWGNKWTKFWLRHNLKDEDAATCFHSLRITVENVLREAGIEQRVRESYLSHEHGSGDVNARYDRVKTREMISCHKPLERPWLKLV